MERSLEALPQEPRATIASLCESTGAGRLHGRLAQSSHAWQTLLRELLAVLLEEQRRREADAAALELQQAFATRAAPALLAMNDMGGSRLALRVVTRDSRASHASAVAFRMVDARAAMAFPTCSGIWHPRRIGSRTACACTTSLSTM